MLLSVCASLAAKIIEQFETKLHTSNQGHITTSKRHVTTTIGVETEFVNGSWQLCGSTYACYQAYKQDSNLENSSALCKALWEHTNADLRDFIQTYQQYTSKNDVHDLLDTLLVTNETTQEEQEELLKMIPPEIRRLFHHNNTDCP